MNKSIVVLCTSSKHSVYLKEHGIDSKNVIDAALCDTEALLLCSLFSVLYPKFEDKYNDKMTQRVSQALADFSYDPEDVERTINGLEHDERELITETDRLFLNGVSGYVNPKHDVNLFSHLKIKKRIKDVIIMTERQNAVPVYSTLTQGISKKSHIVRLDRLLTVTNAVRRRCDAFHATESDLSDFSLIQLKHCNLLSISKNDAVTTRIDLPSARALAKELGFDIVGYLRL